MATEIEIKNLKEQFADIKTATRSNISLIYKALDDLQIPYKKTSCSRCRQDLLNIVREELGLIESAAEESSFNDKQICGYVYKVDRPLFWKGYRIDGNTPVDVIQKFVKKYPKTFDIVECPEESGL